MLNCDPKPRSLLSDPMGLGLDLVIACLVAFPNIKVDTKQMYTHKHIPKNHRLIVTNKQQQN